MPTGDVLVTDYTTVSYSCISFGGVAGAWASPANEPTLVARAGAQLQNFALKFTIPRALVRGATLRLQSTDIPTSISSLYVGLVLTPNVPSYDASTVIDLTNSRIKPQGVYYPVEFHQITKPGPGVYDIDVKALFRNFQSLIYGPTFANLNFIFTSDYLTTLEVIFGILNEDDTPAPVLILDHLVPAQGANNDMSVCDVRHHERWFRCPRCDFWFPISRSVRDGERDGLIVCDSGCADLRGRKDTQKPTREREDRLWPRL